MVVSVAEIGVKDGVWGGIGKRVLGRAGSRAVGQSQPRIGAFCHEGIQWVVWHSPTGPGAFWNMARRWPGGRVRPGREMVCAARRRQPAGAAAARGAQRFGERSRAGEAGGTAGHGPQDPVVLSSGALLPPRLADALERMLPERAVAAMEERRARVSALEKRIAGLERQLQPALANVDKRTEGRSVDGLLTAALREEWNEDSQRLRRRVNRLESVRGLGNPSVGAAKASRAATQQRHPDVVAREPAECFLLRRTSHEHNLDPRQRHQRYDDHRDAGHPGDSPPPPALLPGMSCLKPVTSPPPGTEHGPP